MPEVTITPAKTEPARSHVTRLYPLYIEELSTYTDYYQHDENGVWQPDHLPDWLNEPLQHPFLIEVDGDAAGLCFIAEAPFPHMKPNAEFQVSEFYVLPAFRKQGIGATAARIALDLFRGRWAVTELELNTAAIAFWRKVIGQRTNEIYDESKEPGEIVQRFAT